MVKPKNDEKEIMKCANCQGKIDLKVSPYMPLFEEQARKQVCRNCGWIVNLVLPNTFQKLLEREDFDPITWIERNPPEVEHRLYFYPPLKNDDLDHLPEKLRLAVVTFFKDPDKLTDKQRQNIYHNLYRQSLEELEQKIKSLKTRKRFTKFFQSTNLFKEGGN